MPVLKDACLLAHTFQGALDGCADSRIARESEVGVIWTKVDHELARGFACCIAAVEKQAFAVVLRHSGWASASAWSKNSPDSISAMGLASQHTNCECGFASSRASCNRRRVQAQHRRPDIPCCIEEPGGAEETSLGESHTSAKAQHLKRGARDSLRVRKNCSTGCNSK